MSKVQRFWCDEARNIRCVREDDFDALEAEAQALREEVAELRARVVVLPSVDNVMNIVMRYQWNEKTNVTGTTNWAANLGMRVVEEVKRLNGKTVSEGLLRKWLELMEHGDYREGHCMCGSPVDSHGIGDGHAPIDAGEYYAGQVMEELRDLLSEQEGGNDVSNHQ